MKNSTGRTLSISVGTLVTLTCGGGSLGTGFMSPGRGAAGTRGHQELQARRPAGYRAEEPVSFTAEFDDLRVEVTGRIDGIFAGDNPHIVEEIKTTERELSVLRKEPNPVHEAQLLCYAYIYAALSGFDEIRTRLTYIQLHTDELLEIDGHYNIEALKEFFFSLLDIYVERERERLARLKLRDQSIAGFSFPYGDFRDGQRRMAVEVFRNIRDEGQLFIQAPTGTGKTIAALFPAVKNLGEGHIDRIFYLTARTVGRTVAEKALNDMRAGGLKLKSVVLTAKDKICLLEERNCDPEVCRYALNYYDKLDDSIKQLLETDHFNMEVLQSLGMKHELCPFELSLDLALHCDCIIGDYNYLFDPRVYLKRFFEQVNESYTLLLDEAHNLPDRARSMYSAEISKNGIMEVKRAVKEALPRLAKSLQKMNKLFLDEKRKLNEADGTTRIIAEPPAELLKAMRSFNVQAERWLAEQHSAAFKPLLLDFYFECVNFIRTSELYGENYIYYSELNGKNNPVLRLYCVDPAPLMKTALKRVRSAAFFSATLLPPTYFRRMILGTEDSAQTLLLSSPFPPENLNLMIHGGIATTYRKREGSYPAIADLIVRAHRRSGGNCLVFFPSFLFMEKTAEYLAGKPESGRLLIQDRKMDEPAREAFLKQFSDGEKNILGMAVLGGIFGEGIDLVGEQLTGVIVVGVGLPQLCFERDYLKNYFASRGEDGFAYAYRFPGFNKVMQAAGRLIRTETDRGHLILIDERFTSADYRSLFPPEWADARYCRTTEELLRGPLRSQASSFSAQDS